jgi:hypothetical protein
MQTKKRQKRSDRTYTDEQLQELMLHSEKFTVNEWAYKLDLSKSVVYWIGYQYRLKFKGIYKTGVKRSAPKPKVKPEAKVIKMERPPAQYSNSGNWQLTQGL